MIDWKQYFPSELEQREETYEECVARLKSAKPGLTRAELREKYGEEPEVETEWDELLRMYPREI